MRLPFAYSGNLDRNGWGKHSTYFFLCERSNYIAAVTWNVTVVSGSGCDMWDVWEINADGFLCGRLLWNTSPTMRALPLLCHVIYSFRISIVARRQCVYDIAAHAVVCVWEREVAAWLKLRFRAAVSCHRFLRVTVGEIVSCQDLTVKTECYEGSIRFAILNCYWPVI